MKKINFLLFRLIFLQQKSSCDHTLVQVETPLICPFVGLIGEKVIIDVDNDTTPANNGTDNSASKKEDTTSGGMSKTGEKQKNIVNMFEFSRHKNINSRFSGYLGFGSGSLI